MVSPAFSVVTLLFVLLCFFLPGAAPLVELFYFY